MTSDEIEQKLYFGVIAAFYEVHNALGFGFNETHYVRALDWELRERQHAVAREVGIRIRYKHIDLGFARLDMIVDGRLVVEVKATEFLPPHSSKQVYNYLRATDLETGLLLHFGPKPVFHKVFCRPRHKLPSIALGSEQA